MVRGTEYRRYKGACTATKTVRGGRRHAATAYHRATGRAISSNRSSAGDAAVVCSVVCAISQQEEGLAERVLVYTIREKKKASNFKLGDGVNSYWGVLESGGAPSVRHVCVG